MKKIIVILTLFVISLSLLSSQNRNIARGADPGELYMTNYWFGILNPIWGHQNVYDTLRVALYRLTENGKKLTIQYETCYFTTDPEYEMFPSIILADATTGVLYNKLVYSKNSYAHTQLWFSDDYGKNWTFREENSGRKTYYISNNEGFIYRASIEGENQGTFESSNYAISFDNFEGVGLGMESGLLYGEGFRLWASGTYNGRLFHSFDFYETFTEFSIDNQFMYGSLSGLMYDVYRGGVDGEVYISSWFPPNAEYRVSFSDDLGENFRHVYICNDCYYPYGWASPGLITYFMSDREPGVFYIIKQREIETPPPSWGWYMQFCIEHYKDYGETLVGTYCHDLTKDYGTVCEAVTNLTAVQYIGNSVLVCWLDDSSLPVDSFWVYKKTVQGTRFTVHGEEEWVQVEEGVAGRTRNDVPGRTRNDELVGRVFGNEMCFLDEGLDEGEYEYYVVAYYVTGCVSEESAVASVEVSVCDGVSVLVSQKCEYNCVLLEWEEPEMGDRGLGIGDDVVGYNVFRNGALLNSELVIDTFYVDDNMLAGEYDYFVVSYYSNGCASDSSNVVTEIVLSCDKVEDLDYTLLDYINIYLTWSEPLSVHTVLGYNVFKNGALLNSLLPTEREYLDENLPDGTYLYQVSTIYAHCESEKSAAEVIISIPQFCETPTNLSVVAAQYENSALITWEAPVNIDSELQGYNVYRDNILINSVLINETEYLDENLINGTYFYQVSAVYDFCGESAKSAAVEVVIFVPQFCDVPTNLSVNVAQYENSAVITWEAPENIDSELLGYNVYRDNVLINSVLINETEYLDENLTNGTYFYQVSAVYDFCGESEKSASIEVVVFVPQFCDIPTNLSVAAAQYENSAIITWDVPENIDSELLGYNIYRDNILINSVLINETEYLDENLTNGTYFYQVSAVYDFCESDKSAAVEVVIFVPQFCDVPTNLSAVAAQYENSAVITWEPPINIDSELLGYNLYRDNILINSVLINETEYLDENLTNGTYFYQVSAVYDFCGESAKSAAVGVVVFVPQFCETPTNLSVAVAQYENSAVITWNAPENIDSELLGYNLYRDNILINSVLINETEYLDENLPNGTYFYEVSAVYDFCGESAKSAAVEVVIFVPQFCDIPQNLSVVAAQYENSAVITWNEPENIDSDLLGYNVYRDSDLINSELVNETEYLDENLQNGTYFYQVSAVYDFCGESDLTESVSVEINVGIETLRVTSEITIYPNPTSGVFSVFSFQFSENSNVIHPLVELFDITGRKLLTFKLDKLSTEIDISHLSAGIYFLKIGNEMVKVVKK
ncbi:MAG: T9SS type A sorting domain-containing protein [Marinilabiliaceae bacterium]|nr:T9SS type A sorting domain-containing protein [Marinilabiliaceae bacterium]